MRGTSSSGDKLTGDFGNGVGALAIGDHDVHYVSAEKMLPPDFGLLQHNRLESGHSWPDPRATKCH